jgi:cell division protein FtsB
MEELQRLVSALRTENNSLRESRATTEKIVADLRRGRPNLRICLKTAI